MGSVLFSLVMLAFYHDFPYIPQSQHNDDFHTLNTYSFHSFGQRYQKAADTPDVIVTHQRVPRVNLVGEMDCLVCADTKPVDEFPRFSITASCTHSPNTCLDCVQLSIESDLSSKLWTDIRCPECRELLEYADIQRYANQQTFLRYA